MKDIYISTNMPKILKGYNQIVLDGKNCTTVNDFYCSFSRVTGLPTDSHPNPDAFTDYIEDLGEDVSKNTRIIVKNAEYLFADESKREDWINIHLTIFKRAISYWSQTIGYDGLKKTTCSRSCLYY